MPSSANCFEASFCVVNSCSNELHVASFFLLCTSQVVEQRHNLHFFGSEVVDCSAGRHAVFPVSGL